MPTSENDSATATPSDDEATIVVPQSVYDGMLAHARDGAPEEVCGVLAGVRDNGEHRVEARHPAANVARTPRTRYEIDPREQLDLMEEIEDAGREVVGFYHSHPRGPAGPSATDAEQATWPDRSYAIVSLAGGANREANGATEASFGSWRWTGGEFAPEAVRVVGQQ